MRKKLIAAVVLLAIASAVTPALAAPRGLHKEPAAVRVPASVCARCHVS